MASAYKISAQWQLKIKDCDIDDLSGNWRFIINKVETMMFRSLYIVRLVLVVLLPMLLSLAPAMAQTVVYQGTTTPLSVAQVAGDSYVWEIFSDPNVNFATVPGNCPPTSANFVGGNTGTSVVVEWLQPGIYFYKVTARDAALCTMNFKIGMFKVIPVVLEAKIVGQTLTGACQQVKLDASTSTGEITKYEWSLIDQGGTITRQTGISTEFQLSPSYTGLLPANFGIKLVVTDALGNSKSDSIYIKVDSLPVAAVFSSGKLDKDGTMTVDGSVSTGTITNYRWYSSEGKIVGPDNQPKVTLFGAGNYMLTVTDTHGCQSTKSFEFPIDFYHIIVNPDYAKILWSQDTTINVLANDQSTVNLLPGTVRIIKPARLGETKVNDNGSITYTPSQRLQGRDQFDYEVCNAGNLCASATVIIDIFDIKIVIPNGFSPNGDGVNDKLVFGGLEKYPQSKLYIYTRSGQLVYESVDYQNDWDGSTITKAVSGRQIVPTGVYYFILQPGGTDRLVKGFVYIGY